MKWSLKLLPEAVEDIRSLDGTQKKLVAKALSKILQNPLPIDEGGYGKPLGNKNGSELCGFLKIKLKGAGIRIVYKLEKTDTEMLIIVVGAREDSEAYNAAQHRIIKHNLTKPAKAVKKVTPEDLPKFASLMKPK